jgi:hypothetical protein
VVGTTDLIERHPVRIAAMVTSQPAAGVQSVLGARYNRAADDADAPETSCSRTPA